MTAPALLIDGLTRRYGARAAVDGLSLEVPAGAVFGFLGPNGAGKTTAIRCVLGLIRKDAGHVSVFGEADPVALRAQVGALVETPAFHGRLTAYEVLRHSAAYLGRGEGDIAWALDRVGLTAREHDKVKGYSLGMRQRLGIARALVGRPRLLVLDEPTNGLDPRGMKEIRDLLKNLAKDEGITVFVSSHLLGEVEHMCSHVAILEKGRLVAQGSVAELLGRLPRGGFVDVGTPDETAFLAALEGVPEVSTAGRGDLDRLRLQLHGTTPAQTLQVLVSKGAPIDAWVPVAGSLEDVFLHLTAREIT